jgi:hypothetical protein
MPATVSIFIMPPRRFILSSSLLRFAVQFPHQRHSTQQACRIADVLFRCAAESRMALGITIGRTPDN